MLSVRKLDFVSHHLALIMDSNIWPTTGFVVIISV